MKVKLIFTLLILVTVLLEGVHVYLSNRIASTSIEVAQLREEIETLDEKNTALKTELLAYSSFNRIASRAAELGFQESKRNVMVLNAPLQVAISH